MAWEPDYVSVADFKSFTRITDNLDDPHIARAITSGSRAIDKYASCLKNGLGYRRQFGLCDAPEARYYTPRWDTDQARYVVEIDDLMTQVGLVVKFDLDSDNVYETPCTAFILRPKDAVNRGYPWTQIAILSTSGAQPNSALKDSVEVTARFGWTAIPVPIQEATLLQAHRILKRRLSPLGVQGSNQTGSASSETSVEDDLDADAMNIVKSRYRRLARTP